MHTRVARRVHKAVILAIMLSFLLPLGSTIPVAAQGEECPEGLVYLVEDDLCVLPEDVPPDAEFIDQHADDGSDESDASEIEDDTSGQIDLDDATDTEADGNDQIDSEDTEEIEDDGEDQDDTEFIDDTVEEEEGVVGTIKNVNVLTYSCPINWNPATKSARRFT